MFWLFLRARPKYTADETELRSCVVCHARGLAPALRDWPSFDRRVGAVGGWSTQVESVLGLWRLEASLALLKGHSLAKMSDHSGGIR